MVIKVYIYNYITIYKYKYIYNYIMTSGWMLLVVSWVWLSFSTYTMILSKVLPVPQNKILQSIAMDRHYCLLPSASIVMMVIFVFFNWLGLKYFKHN